MSAIATLQGVTHRYNGVTALADATLELPERELIGFIGADGVGKSTLLGLIAGARKVQTGALTVLDGDMRSARHRRHICERIAYMPQGLGKNLYGALTVRENLEFFGRLFGYARHDRELRIDGLLDAVQLSAFSERLVHQLSGGMKQKLALCCALIHDPELLILDEPTTGVDPLSRRRFWDLVIALRERSRKLTVLVATAYMEEAERFDRLVAMHDGVVLANGTPSAVRDGHPTLEAAYAALAPRPPAPPPRRAAAIARSAEPGPAIEASCLTKSFKDFVAVDNLSFRIARGEIFGFVGSNGCGKTTTMKMLTGLEPATSGEARLFGEVLDARDEKTRRRVGYMSQGFSLYTELSVRQNLVLHAKLFGMARDRIAARVDEMLERFALTAFADRTSESVPLGVRQRLSLAAAMVHAPDILILDEPTSGVDPAARDSFWQELSALAHEDGITIFVSTHFMNEAERCDRVALMHAGKVLAQGSPRQLMANRNATNLDDAFVAYIHDVPGSSLDEPRRLPAAELATVRDSGITRRARRIWSYALRELAELARDPIRMSMALGGSVLMMLVLSFGLSMDVDDLPFAVLDRDDSPASRDYIASLASSPYFSQKSAISDYADMDERMRRGDLGLALEIPSGFGRELARGRQSEVGAWVDGSMPTRAETMIGYVEGVHSRYLMDHTAVAATAGLEARFRYNPENRSIVGMAPSIIAILLIFIPAMLSALGVAREKELGSIVNLYVTPVARLEFLIGKQLPYIVLAMLNFVVLVAICVVALDVPVRGSGAALTLGAALYVVSTTALGLLLSTFMRSQLAAVFGTSLATMVPAIHYSGLITPIASLQGAGAVIGQLYPTSHFLAVSQGCFLKALDAWSLRSELLALTVSPVVILALCVVLLRKQAA